MPAGTVRRAFHSLSVAPSFSPFWAAWMNGLCHSESKQQQEEQTSRLCIRGPITRRGASAQDRGRMDPEQHAPRGGAAVTQSVGAVAFMQRAVSSTGTLPWLCAQAQPKAGSARRASLRVSRELRWATSTQTQGPQDRQLRRGAARSRRRAGRGGGKSDANHLRHAWAVKAGAAAAHAATTAHAATASKPAEHKTHVLRPLSDAGVVLLQ